MGGKAMAAAPASAGRMGSTTMGAPDFGKLPHIGEALRRKEDYRFLTGAGQYTDDVNLAHQSHAVFLRRRMRMRQSSPSTPRRASKMPGVVGIFTGKDIDGKMGGLPCGWLINNPDGTPMKEPPHPILAIGKVRFVATTWPSWWPIRWSRPRTPPRRSRSTTRCCPRW